MGLLIAAGILLFCFIATWLVLRRPVRQIVEDVRVDRARALFHRNREHLEARFISTLEKADPDEGERWQAAHWDDDVLWARDRNTHHLLALTGVEFEPAPFELSFGHSHATAIFEFSNGQWCAGGKRVDEMRPEEAIGLFRRFETV